MKSFVVLAVLVAAAAAASIPAAVPTARGDYVVVDSLYKNYQPDAQHAEVLRFENNNIGIDGYQYGFETSNGIRANEAAQLKNVGTENEGIEVRGEFSYIGTDGQTYTVTYVANELGYQPSAPHLPHN